MSTQKSCLSCGTLIPTDSPGELCAPCLFAPALETDSRPEPTESSDLTPILDQPATPLVVKFHSFGDYQLLAEIARGGMGVVFRARQISLDRIVALKFIHPGKLDSPEAAHRFRIEAQAAAGLNHPNIVTIHSVGQRDGVHFLSMELVEGRPLSQLIPPGGFALAKFFDLGIPLTDALAAAHARGIGHRDLKPSNVMLSDQGRIKVIDFGLAKRLWIGTGPGDAGHRASHPTRTGQVLGTTAYMAPEQLEGREADHRSDIFSLGILLFEMATGRRPFTGDSAVGVMSSILRDAPLEPAQLNPSLQEPLCRILDRCLQEAPADRYQSALEVRDELMGLQKAAGIGRNPGQLTTAEMIPCPADSSLAGRTRSGRGENSPGPGNLPAPLTSFIGRERETIEVARLISNDPGPASATIRLLTLTGPGGTGKTRLALQVAARMIDHFPDGVWLVELAALSDATLVTQTVGSALGLLNTTGGSPLEPLVRFLLPKRALLLLDNCEHLVSACADLAGALLRHCPKLQILATSREGLRLTGETTWPVPSLSTPTTTAGRLGPIPLEEVAQYESIRLFVERARAMVPAFELNELNATAVAELCRRLDGIPLAIELAAARTRLLPVEVLLERVQDRFRLFTGGSRTALPRQQTLRAMVDWSYDLLPAQERLLFDRLSVFAGGWTLEAAEAVCGDSTDEPQNDRTTPLEAIRVVDILDLLGRLLEKSMVLAELSTGGKARYHLLETLRQYGQERLAARGESATAAMQCVFRRHSDSDPILSGQDSGRCRTAFRSLPDRIPGASGQQSGTVRTVFRSDPDSVPGHPDSFQPP